MRKRCYKCGIVKDISEFCVAGGRKDGRQAQCKECDKQYRERVREYKKEYDKEYYQNNREHIKECTKEFYQKNKEHIKEVKKAYHQKNKEHFKEYYKEYHRTPNGKARHIRDSHRRRARKKNLEASLTIEEWAYILKKQNNRCNICGKKFTAKRPSERDHIIPLKHNGTYSSDNIQALCKSCNSSKNANLDKQFIQVWTLV